MHINNDTEEVWFYDGGMGGLTIIVHDQEPQEPMLFNHLGEPIFKELNPIGFDLKR